MFKTICIKQLSLLKDKFFRSIKKQIHCRSNISWSSESKVRYHDINGARYKSRHVPCMYNGMYNTHLVCRCGSLMRHH